MSTEVHKLVVTPPHSRCAEVQIQWMRDGKLTNQPMQFYTDYLRAMFVAHDLIDHSMLSDGHNPTILGEIAAAAVLEYRSGFKASTAPEYVFSFESVIIKLMLYRRAWTTELPKTRLKLAVRNKLNLEDSYKKALTKVGTSLYFSGQVNHYALEEVSYEQYCARFLELHRVMRYYFKRIPALLKRKPNEIATAFRVSAEIVNKKISTPKYGEPVVTWDIHFDRQTLTVVDVIRCDN